MSLPRTWSLLIAAGLAAGSGCGTANTPPGQDAGSDASGGSGGTGGTIAADGGPDDGDSGTGCDGFCAPGQPAGFDYGSLVWFGPKQDAPQCPADAASLAFEGHADLDAPFDCGTCTCSSPAGSCGLPSTMTANAATCAQNGASTAHTSFDPASSWTGGCDADTSIASGKLCAGIKCVQSLSIGPLVANETGCTPSQAPLLPTPKWKTFVRACRRVPYEPCTGSTAVCTANPPPGSGFRVCVYTPGDDTCPSFSPYSERHVVYGNFEDTRACTACTCGTATGSSCSSSVSIFSDGACSTPLYTATATSSGPACHDLPAGTPLGSKSATAPTYTPGSCAPDGGQPMGAATPTHPSTYCCLPSP